jgi:hypothetical protein
MEVEEIEVTIDKHGQVQLHVRGVKGKKCLVLTKDLEQALGAQVVQRDMTPEAQENASGNAIDQTIKVRRNK